MLAMCMYTMPIAIFTVAICGFSRLSVTAESFFTREKRFRLYFIIILYNLSFYLPPVSGSLALISSRQASLLSGRHQVLPLPHLPGAWVYRSSFFSRLCFLIYKWIGVFYPSGSNCISCSRILFSWQPGFLLKSFPCVPVCLDGKWSFSSLVPWISC